jgi:oligopeptide/dipeptide ABC transporter ATP-binding protein
VGFEQPTSGRVLFSGQDFAEMGRTDREGFRRNVQMMFQNPFAALNLFRTVRDTLTDGLRARGVPKAQRPAQLSRLMEQTGLGPRMLDRYPHEFSGGQRQRIVLARSLSVAPKVLIADEPVSALDVSIQAQVLNLLNALRRELDLTIVMITHDLRVVNFFCDRVAVMYRGRIVEVGARRQIMTRARHPYTRMLISAAPHDKPGESPARPWVRSEIDVDTPPPTSGCNFANRCWLRTALGNPESCVTQRPELRTFDDDAVSTASCHFAERTDEFARKRIGEGVDGHR